EIAELKPQEIRSFYTSFGAKRLSQVLSAGTPSAGVGAVLSLDGDARVATLNRLSAYYLADGVRPLPEPEAQQILNALDPSVKEGVERLVQWDGESAGGNMTPSFLTLPGSTRAEEALTTLRALAKNVEA